MNATQYNQNQPRLTTRQAIGNVSGGMVVGNVSGGTVIGNLVHIFNLPPSTSNNPPNEAIVLAYLTRLSQQPKPDFVVNDKQKKLWDVPVAVHASEYGAETKDIWDAIKDVFARQNPDRFIPRVLLLAEAGMGRTPALLQVQAKVAAESRVWLQEYLSKSDDDRTLSWKRNACVLPIYVSLMNIKAGGDLLTLIRDRFNAILEQSGSDSSPADGENQIDSVGSKPIGQEVATSDVAADDTIQPIKLEEVPALLNRYQCLFLLDDLELIFTGGQPGAVEAVNHFMESNPHQYVIACRASSDWHPLGHVARLYLADFPKDNARLLLGADRYRRLEATTPDLVRNRASLHRLLGSQQRILEQSTGLLVQEDIRERLSRHKDVFEKYDLQQEVAERLLESLALAMYHRGLITLNERQAMELVTEYLDEWHERLHWRDALAALTEAEMLQGGEGLRLWTFRHQRAPAYFAAAAVAANPGELQKVLDKASDYRWRPVLELLTGLLPNPSDFIFELIDRDALVAAICTDAAGKAADPSITTAVIDALLEHMKHETSLRRQPIVERIGNSGHPRALETLLLALQQEWSSRVVMSIVFAVLEWCAHLTVTKTKQQLAQTEKRLLQTSQRQYFPVADVLTQCKVCWTHKGGRHRQQAVDELIRISRDIERPALAQGQAVIGLGIAGTPEARARLLELFTDQQANDFLAWCGVEALCLVSKHDGVEDAAIALYDGAEHQTDAWARHRARAVYLLGYISYGDTTSERLQRALCDPNPFVRSCTVEALAQLDWRAGEARRLIERRLNVEHDPLVLRRIAEALGRIGTLATIVDLQPLLRCPVARTRWAAQHAIAEIHNRHGN